jgi:hypothetical protein
MLSPTDMATTMIDVGATPVSVPTVLPPILRWGVKPVTIHTLPCTVYHQSPSREDTTRPIFRDLGDLALSVRHRPDFDPALTPSTVRRGRNADVAQCSGSFRRLIPDVTRDGRPLLGHAATVTPTGTDKTSPQGSPVSWPPLTL